MPETKQLSYQEAHPQEREVASEFDLAFIQSPEMDMCLQQLKNIQNLVERNDPITTSALENISQILSSLQVNVWDETIKLGNLDSYMNGIPDLQENMKIWHEVMEGTWDTRWNNITKLSFIDPMTAKSIVAHFKDYPSLIPYFKKLTLYSQEVIRIMSGLRDLRLDQKVLPPELAKEFAKKGSGELVFYSPEISVESARELSRSQCPELSFGSACTFGPGAIQEFAPYQGDFRLGMTDISSDIAREMTNFRCEKLSLFGVVELSAEVARELIKYPGVLYFHVLKPSPEVAEILLHGEGKRCTLKGDVEALENIRYAATGNKFTPEIQAIIERRSLGEKYKSTNE